MDQVKLLQILHMVHQAFFFLPYSFTTYEFIWHHLMILLLCLLFGFCYVLCTFLHVSPVLEYLICRFKTVTPSFWGFFCYTVCCFCSLCSFPFSSHFPHLSWSWQMAALCEPGSAINFFSSHCFPVLPGIRSLVFSLYCYRFYTLKHEVSRWLVSM